MKTHLGARTDKKTLEGESKFHLHTEERLVSKSPFGTFGVLNGTLTASFGLWPNRLRVTKRHTLFDLFAKG